MRFVAAGLALVVALPLGLSAADDGGQAAAWTRMAFGARSAALGQAVNALAEDPYAVQVNPALLATLSRCDVASQGGLLPDGRNLDYLGVARPMDEKMAWGWGLSWGYFSDSTPYEARSANTLEPDGTFYSNASLVQGSLGGWALDRVLAFGVGFKVYYADLDSASANGVGVDLGAFYRAWPWLDLGLSLQDAYGRLGWSTGASEEVPLRSGAGARLKFLDGTLDLSLQAMLETDQGPHAMAGLEWWAVPEHLAVRAGFQDGQFSLGLGGQGVIMGMLSSLDYTVGTDASAGDQLQQRLSLTLGFDL